MSCSNTSATRKELKCVNLELKMFFHWWTNLELVFILGAKVFDVQVAPWHTGTGLDPHRENPVETENSIPPFALPTSLLSNPALGKSDVFSQEMWHRFIFFRSSLGWDIEAITLKLELAKSDTMKYFRKIQNGRQIMFQCDRGYSMIEGPSGATCIAGLSHAKDHYDDNF